ncbi:MAG: PKD domain-containing protein [Candidatus Nanopelagicales bacterium]
MPRTRPTVLTVLLTALALVLGLVAPVAVAAPAAAAVPTTCTTGRAGDSCSISSETATSVTISATFTYGNRRYVEADPKPDDWYSLFIRGGSFTCGPSISGSTVGYYIWSLATPGSIGCSVTFSWPAGQRPASVAFQVVELRGDGITLPNGGHSAVAEFPRSPTSSIYADPTPGGPDGSYDFGATSVSAYQGRTITAYQWSFGDGTTRTTTTPLTTYRYTRAGTFTASLYVVDSGGLTSTTTTKTITVSVPSIAVSVSPAVPRGGLGTGANLSVPITVTAVGTDLTGVRLALSSAPSGVLALGTLTPAVPPAGLTLAKGTSWRGTITVTGKAVGRGSVTVAAQGTSAAGTVTGSGSGVVPVVSGALVVKARTKPGTIALPVSKKGVVGKRKVKVTFTLTNTSKSTLKSVTMERVYPRPVVRTDPLDQIDFPRGTFPLKVGTIKPKASVKKTLTLTVTGDGQYKLDHLTSFRVGGGTDLAAAQAGTFKVTVPAMWFDADMDGSKTVGKGKVQFVKGGRAFFLSGRIKNLSSYRTLCLWPLRPTLKGNAGGIGPVDLRTYSSTEKVAPPVAGPLKAGATLPFAMQVRTRADGGTRATVSLSPQASAISAGAACDATTVTRGKPLAASDRIITKGSTKHVGGVDVSVPGAEPTTALQIAGNFAGGFTIGAIATVAETLSGTVIAAREAFSGYTSEPALLLPTFEAINATAAVLCHYWDTATPEEKDRLFGQVRSVLRRASGDAWKGLDAGVSSAFEGFMAKVETAYATGDNRALAYALGYGAGSTVTQIGIDMVTAEIGASLAKKVPALAKAFAVVGGESVTFAAMKDIPAGKLLNPTEMRKLWGAASADVAAFSRIAKEEGVLIAIRSRAPISVQNLGKGAVWKHENLKPKNVSWIDIAYLGFDKADNGLVALKRYSAAEKSAIQSRIKKAKLSAGQRAEVLDRMETRFNEADKYLKKIEGFSAAQQIDVGFNYAENGLDVATDSKVRKFQLTGSKQASGSTYYRPWQENVARSFPSGSPLPTWCKDFGSTLGILCRVTGDMDGVYLTTATGRPLPLNKLLRVYRKLAQAGWQHPETFTWTEQLTGAFDFKAKRKILGGLTKGGEKLMEFGPDGKARAVWIDLTKSWFGDARHYFVGRVGGFTNLVRR